MPHVLGETYNSTNTNISACGIIEEPGIYTMNQSITNNTLADSCINITAENVTLDCAGHYIKSSDDKTGVYSNKFNTTIKNCNISMSKSIGGFGIYFFEANNSYIINNSLNNQYWGIYLENTSSVLAENNTANSNHRGIYMSWSLNNTIKNNTLCSNSDDGIHFHSSSKNIFINNIVIANGNEGIRIRDISNHNQIKNNQVKSNNEGISIYMASHNFIFNNTIYLNTNYGINIEINSTNNTIQNNTIFFNEWDGVHFNAVENNTVVNCNIRDNAYYDFSMDIDSETQCNHIFVNVSGSGGNPILFYNHTINLSDQTISELVLCNADNSNITNIIISGNQSNNAFVAIRTDNTTFARINSSNVYIGVYIDFSYNNIIQDSIFNFNTYGIVASGVNNSFKNITIIDSKDDSIYNSLLNLSLFENIFINTSYDEWNDGIITFYKAYNNLFKDSIFLLNNSKDYIMALYMNSMNNTFLNATYNSSKEYAESNSELIRKWYLDVYVSSAGTGLSNANVTAWNSTDEEQFSALTGTNGRISTQRMTEYKNSGGTRYYYGNYTINATKLLYTTDSQNINLTSNTLVEMNISSTTTTTTTITTTTESYGSGYTTTTAETTSVSTSVETTAETRTTNKMILENAEKNINYIRWLILIFVSLFLVFIFKAEIQRFIAHLKK